MSQQHPENAILENWNRFEQDTAMKAILPCNGSRAWAIGVVNAYPFDTPEQLFAASDQVWRNLKESDWQQAFDSHPRIGEKEPKSASEQSSSWSENEQKAATPDEATAAELVEANKRYEEKFGRIFIVCATGKTAREMLTILRNRLVNGPEKELQEAVEQQRRITQLRLRKWLALPAAACEEV